LRIQEFLKRKDIKGQEDFILQNQLFAYFVAKHYGISPQEVYEMPINMFRQSLSWALAMQDNENKEAARANMQSQTGNETITLDYGFLDMEDI